MSPANRRERKFCRQLMGRPESPLAAGIVPVEVAEPGGRRPPLLLLGLLLLGLLLLGLALLKNRFLRRFLSGLYFT